MKTKALVLTFAVCAGALAAQQQGTAPTPSQELAPIVAVEEQERDLAKAERLYKEAIDGGKLSAAAKHQAMLRLAELLMKLGRRDEAMPWMAKAAESPFADRAFDDVTAAAPQDRERQEALRAKARELVPKAMGQICPVDYWVGTVGIVDRELLRQIEWLGDAAVPEIAAVLAVTKETLAGKAARDLPATASRGAPNQDNAKLEAVRGLVGALWSSGSPMARAQLEAAYRDGSEAFRMVLVCQAARHSASIRDLIVLWLQQDPSDAVFWALARSGLSEPTGGGGVGEMPWADRRSVWSEVAHETLLGAVDRRGPLVQGKVLAALYPKPDALGRREFSAEAVARACSLIRTLAKGTDPEAARLALRGLVSFQKTAEGFECLVDHLGLYGPDGYANWDGGPREWGTKEGRDFVFDVKHARRLWPKLVAAARLPLSPGLREWISYAIQASAKSLDGAIVDDLVSIYEPRLSPALEAMRGRMDPSQAMRLLEAFGRICGPALQKGDPTTHAWFRALGESDLPPEALPLLVSLQKLAEGSDVSAGWFSPLVARTGNPEAVAWLVERAEVGAFDLTDCLVQLGRRTQAEPLRAAMRQLAEKVGSESKSRLYLALLAMHDTATLARLGEIGTTLPAVEHAYATAKTPKSISPLGYVLMDQPDPPHGFTEAELLAFVRNARVFESPKVEIDDPARVPTSLLMALAERSDVHFVISRSRSVSSWQQAMATRIAEEEDMEGPLHRWLLGVLTRPGPGPNVVAHLGERDRAVIRPELERMLAGDDAERAMFAFSVLEDFEPAPDFAALTASKHKDVASLAASRAMDRGTLPVAVALRLLPGFPAPWEIATYCGNKLAVEAVPALLQLLQHDNDSVREVASEALAKIRAAHEQRSYWDRITKGLDASPTSAVEKLLLQAKPGAPRAQRLLAIPSLGALGVPEALPFLIEWTQDADAEVAVAATKAIQQIHLNPRR